MFNSILYLNAAKLLGLSFVLAAFFVVTVCVNIKAAKMEGLDHD